MTGAIAKEGKRIIDPEVLRWVVHERDRVCLYGLFYSDPCQFGLDPHHIEKRSGLGDDIPENLITLCRKHHDQAEENTIPKEHLQGILNALYGYGG